MASHEEVTINKDGTSNPFIEVETTIEDESLLYDIHEQPPLIMTFLFSLQQVLMSLSRSLSTALLVADVVCARTDESYKARLLSTTLFVSGVCTLLQNTIGIRLPLYQGPAATYVVPLLALASLPEWKCPDFTLAGVETIDEIIRMLLGNPVFVAGFTACFLDNTCPGTPEERGMVAWKSELQGEGDENVTNSPEDDRTKERLRRVNKTIYRVPFADKLLKRFPLLRYIPIYPK